MATFEAIDEFLDDTLQLPLAGKLYVIRCPDAKTGLRVKRLFADSAKLADSEEQELHLALLGETHQQLLDDGVSSVAYKHVAETALIWVAFGTEPAAEYWRQAGRPEAASPVNRRGRRAMKSAATAVATPTPKPVSMTTTTTSPTRSGTGTPATRSRGRKS